MFKRPLSISLSPNIQKDDLSIALKSLFSPFILQNGTSLGKLKDVFRKTYGTSDIYLFNSGRSALYCLLKSFNIGFGDEVIVQGFTCVAVPDPVIWVGAKPIYSDIDESLNIDPRKLEQLINVKTKAIIVQHTFGVPAEIIMIKKIAQKYNLILIEDCAHSLGGAFRNNKLGSIGDAAFFSFGRDKIISSVFGGAGFINKNEAANSKLKDIYDKLPNSSNYWTLKQLLYPLLFSVILPLYDIYIGKLLLFLFINLKLIDKPVEKKELEGKMPSIFPSKMPNALAALALNQINKLEKFNLRRLEIAKIYYNKLKGLKSIKLPIYKKGSVFLRFNIFVENRDKIFAYFKKRKILLGKWYSNVIDPTGVNYYKIDFIPRSLPNAHSKAKTCLNLPTYPLMTDNEVSIIVDQLKKYENSTN